MAAKTNLLPLKLLAISLAAILLGGIVFVVILIAGKAGGGDCPDATFALNGRGTLAAIAPSGNNVQMTLVAGGKTQVLTVDRCNGKVLQTLTIVP